MKGLKGRENVMVEEAAQAAGIMTTDLKGIPCLMTRIAMSLRFDNGCDYLVAYTWIQSHSTTPFLGRLVVSGRVKH
ncbi:hypothetical protein SBDP1_920004 [Syntrophobacter sp. SbD1]|nr:hypothetical protein SBDP1_920004 [Syntrophobacter sp. SbD1]